MNAAALGLVLLALSTAAIPGTPAPSTAAIEHAAVNALRHLATMPEAASHEYLGIISRNPNGTIYYSMFPRTDHATDHVKYSPETQVIPGDTVIGIFHNHPCMPKTHIPHEFSSNDILMGFVYHAEVFMLDDCTGDVHAFAPGKDHAKDTSTGHILGVNKDGNFVLAYTVKGRIVGNIGRTFPDQDP